MEDLLRKYLEGECTPSEVEQVLRYLETPAGKASLQKLLDQEEVLLNPETLPLPEAASGPLEESEAAFLRVWSRLEPSLAQPSVAVAGEKRRPGKHYPFPTWMAAACLGALLLAGWLAWQYLHPVLLEQNTAYGEVRTITLPDGSTVVLNGNSALRYEEGWGDTGKRRVWLEGEAFFSVRHTENHQPFVVHTRKGLGVEVLGTEFNVADRRQSSQVVLQSGQIRLLLGGNGQPRQLLLQPGDLVAFSANPEIYVRKKVDPRMYSAWKDRRWVLDATSFGQIVERLEETYGLSVQVPDQDLLRKRFTGTIPTDNLDLLLEALAVSCRLRLHRDGSAVIFYQQQ